MAEQLRTSTVLVDKPVIDVSLSCRMLQGVDYATQVLFNGFALYLLVALLCGVYSPSSVNTVIPWIVLSVTVAHLLRQLLPMILKQRGRHTCMRVYPEDVRLANYVYGVVPTKAVLVKVLAIVDTSLLPLCVWFLVFPSSESPVFVKVFSSLLHLNSVGTGSSSRVIFYCTLWLFVPIFLLVRVVHIWGLTVTRCDPFFSLTQPKLQFFLLIVSGIVGWTEVSTLTFLLSSLPCDGSVLSNSLRTFSANASAVSLTESLGMQLASLPNTNFFRDDSLSAKIEMRQNDLGNETVNWHLRFDKGTVCLSPSHKASIVFSLIFWCLCLCFSDVVLGTLRKLQEASNAAALPYQEKIDGLFLVGMRFFRAWIIVLSTCTLSLRTIENNVNEMSSAGVLLPANDTRKSSTTSLVPTVRYGKASRVGLVLLVLIPSMLGWLCMKSDGFMGRRFIASTDVKINSWYQAIFLKVAVLCVAGVFIHLVIYFMPAVVFFGYLVWWIIWLGWGGWDIFCILFR